MSDSPDQNEPPKDVSINFSKFSNITIQNKIITKCILILA